MARWGLPYQGSKNGIADWVVDNLPPSDCFVDLFAGGCAVTHCAMVRGKWQKIIANDRQGDILQLFKNAVDGKYRNEKRWISREDFARLKDYDPYVKYCWSFGNRGENYLYAWEIEPFKHRLHDLFYAETIQDRRFCWRAFIREFFRLHEDINKLTKQAEQLCKECNVECLRNEDGTINAAKIKDDVFRVLSAEIRQYMRGALKKSGKKASDIDKLLGTNGMAGHYFGESQWELPTAKAYAQMQTIMPDLKTPWAELNERLQSLESLQSLQSLERLQSLESLQSLERLESLECQKQNMQYLTIYNMDYRAVELPSNATIYCDPPYRGTAGYHGDTFDFDAFDSWLEDVDRLVIVSEYTAPKNCVCVAKREKPALMSGSRGGGDKVTEGLFVHEKHVKEYEESVKIGKTMTLF